jgi:DNA-binding PadR family transcriptional regulator
MSERSRTKYIILGMLTLGDQSGYEIAKMIKSSTHYFWAESMGQIYPALAQCLKEGLITCKESSQSKRVKKTYAITALGKKALAAWLKKEPQPTLVRNELLLKLFFGRNVDNRDNIKHILHQKNLLESELQTCQEIRQQILSQNKSAIDAKYWLITVDYGLKVIQAELGWCNDTLKVLEAK